ncbi:hypothetical protein TVAG_198770 [Trichomonas vaginalis G3]|uniref:Uncharacterized protein n=1 Tax=Trichomonas vaginalis (strain ATCC PRA-98 / G3) TaxID=412133 RepID=A2DDR2_TRIV3|nr:hypothetical protein TVAGG3_0999200 [Trichomonas vaginalis G3]EAY21438.1 hypothetical protein TVAG_198770 [Trichomonas vaginalis G3]KAI5490651.1 hypothetical protein TVAGG3_0999200 [Trichomonas vaginalis G3]|eukprot:XP_001582424.1 hypothetical protein [Trichomonas vaginalis G3]
MSDQQFAKMEDLNPKEPGSNLKTDDSRERTINIVVGIFSFIVPFLGFILTCVYWSTNRFRSWLCFGLDSNNHSYCFRDYLRLRYLQRNT